MSFCSCIFGDVFNIIEIDAVDSEVQSETRFFLNSSDLFWKKDICLIMLLLV